MSKILQKRARGQSFVLVAVVIVALVLIVGLAVDASNAYATQRKAQSTANAAAIAGTKRLAMARDNPGSYSDVDIRAEINGIVVLNGFDPDQSLTAEYIDQAGNVIGQVGSIGGGDTPPPENAVYIRVRIGTQVDTYFVRLAGFPQVGVNASTQARNVPLGAPGCTQGIYPIGVHRQDFVTGEDYWIWDGDPNEPESPGNFGWLQWRNEPGFGGTDHLVRALTPPGNLGDPDEGYFDGSSHILGYNKPMWGNTGLSNNGDVLAMLQYFVNSGELLILPLWDNAAGGGGNVVYTNAGFGIFRLEEVCFHHGDCSDMPEDVPNNAKTMHLTFLGYSGSGCTVSEPVDPGSGGGGQNYATAQGMVYMCTLEPVLLPPDQGSHLPVDIVHLVDSSDSMSRPLVGGGGKAKIQIEKEALVYFNNLMRPDLGDRLGGVKFRNMNQDVVVLTPLTWNIADLNNQINAMSPDGYTPWAKAVLKGTETLYGLNRNPDNKPVLIIASDGAPTVDADNQTDLDYQLLEWSEMTPATLRYCYEKDTCSTYPGCVSPAHGCPGGYRQQDPGVEVLIDALDAADVVKGRTTIAQTWFVRRHGGTCNNISTCPFYGAVAHQDMEIFVIAIKGSAEFSASVLQYVATAPASEHYFEMQQESDAQGIYLQIANAISGQLPYCYIGATQTPYGGGVDLQIIAGGAVVGSGDSNSSGSYQIPNVPVDPYLIYTITGTASYGGTEYGVASGCLNSSPVGLAMPLPQAYDVPLYLVPDTQPVCPEGTIEIPPP
jgi:hypothetical protein